MFSSLHFFSIFFRIFENFRTFPGWFWELFIVKEISLGMTNGPCYIHWRSLLVLMVKTSLIVVYQWQTTRVLSKEKTCFFTNRWMLRCFRHRSTVLASVRRWHEWLSSILLSLATSSSNWKLVEAMLGEWNQKKSEDTTVRRKLIVLRGGVDRNMSAYRQNFVSKNIF